MITPGMNRCISATGMLFAKDQSDAYNTMNKVCNKPVSLKDNGKVTNTQKKKKKQFLVHILLCLGIFDTNKIYRMQEGKKGTGE